MYHIISLQKFHFSLDSNKSQLLCRAVTIVEEQFLSGLDVPFGENTNSVISVYHENFRTAVGIDGVVGKSYFIAFPCGVHNVLVVEVEEEAAHVLVVHFPPPVGLVLRDDLPAVLGYKLVLVSKIFYKN